MEHFQEIGAGGQAGLSAGSGGISRGNLRSDQEGEFTHTGCLSLATSLGAGSAPSARPDLAAAPPSARGPSLPGVPTSQQGPPAADYGPPALGRAHPCLRLATTGRGGQPALLTRPDPGGGLSAHPPLPSTGPGLRPHSPQRRAPADRQSRRRARSSRSIGSSEARRRTTTPRSSRAPRGTVGSTALVLQQ